MGTLIVIEGAQGLTAKINHAKGIAQMDGTQDQPQRVTRFVRFIAA